MNYRITQADRRLRTTADEEDANDAFNAEMRAKAATIFLDPREAQLHGRDTYGRTVCQRAEMGRNLSL